MQVPFLSPLTEMLSVTVAIHWELYDNIVNVNCRSSLFVCRNVNAWNSLPEHVVKCATAATFKRKLSTVDLTQFVNL